MFDRPTEDVDLCTANADADADAFSVAIDHVTAPYTPNCDDPRNGALASCRLPRSVFRLKWIDRYEGVAVSPNSERLDGEAWRLVINYRAGDVTLEEVIPLNKLLPPSDELPEGGPEGELSGFWFELRNRSGRTTYRQIESNPLVHACSDVIEEREGDGTQLRRLAAVADVTTFTFLIPRPRGTGAHVVIFSSPLDAVAEGIGAPAEPRWRIELPADQPE